MTTLYADTETFSPIPLRRGVHRYAEDVEVMVLSFAFDDERVEVWDLQDLSHWRPALQEMLDEADRIVFHQAHFDRTVLRHVGVNVPLEKLECTMARAYAHSLPGGLEKLCAVMKVPEELWKQPGKELIKLFCQPRPKNSKIRRATRATHPEEWKRFLEYAKFDIESMRVLDRKLPTWNYSGRELALWRLDQRINDRGVRVDVDLSKAAIAAADRERRRLGDRANALTNDEIGNLNQRDKLLTYLLLEHGVSLPDMTGDTLERRLNDPELSDVVKELLVLRLQVAGTAVAKYNTLLNAVSKDGRLRGLLQFAGASRTARWSGRIFQPQNLTRVPRHLKKIYDDVAECIKNGSLELIYGDKTLETLGYMVRGAIIPEPLL